MQRICRTELKNAPYNPRILNKTAARKLRESLKTNGLLQPIIFNQRTGHIVGGHQRVAQLDAIETKPDYFMDVAVVDLDDKQERAVNIQLNNTAVMGSWDMDALGDMLKDIGDLESTGFEIVDLQLMFDDPDLSGLATEADPAAKEIEAVESIRKRKKDWKDKQDVKNDPNFQVVLVFKDSAEVDEFLMRLDLPIDQKFVDGRRIARMLGGKV